ncbi:nitroreductase family protein [Polystyrenella longa]|nr:nitroreductase [Polystyrenella longa]
MPEMSLPELLVSRRTIHQFRTDHPPEELIEQALELARWVPNHKKTEPWRFYWLGAEARQAVVDLNCEMLVETKGAKRAEEKRKSWEEKPGWIVVTAPYNEDPVRQQEDYASCCCAIHNFALFLWSHEIGVKWTSGPVTRDPQLLKIIGAELEREYCVGLLWYGYPEMIPQQNRQPLSDVLIRVP